MLSGVKHCFTPFYVLSRSKEQGMFACLVIGATVLMETIIACLICGAS